MQAHQPDGVVVRAFHFPDRLVPEIDGDLTDWRLIDRSYVVSTEQLTDLVDNADRDHTDLDVSLLVGWNDTHNRIYVSATVTDDLHQIDRPDGTPPALIFQDDDLEVFIDADHSGGQFADFSDLTPEDQLRANGTTANHFILSGPAPPGGDFFVNFSAAGWYSLPDGPFTQAAVARPVGAGETVYEFSLTPFDRIDVGASFLSAEHDLRENEIIGFNVEFNDFDLNPNLYDAKWSLSGGHNAFRLSERFSDLRLEGLREALQPTLTETPSWGQIKASIRP